MKISVEEGIITINATKGDTIVFREASLTEFSNALMIIRQLNEKGPLEDVSIKYGTQPHQRRVTDKGEA